MIQPFSYDFFGFFLIVGLERPDDSQDEVRHDRLGHVALVEESFNKRLAVDVDVAPPEIFHF